MRIFASPIIMKEVEAPLDRARFSLFSKTANRLAYIAGGLILLALIFLSLIGPLWLWPQTDEANYILQARQMAEGMLPYRDFYEFITPGGQWLASLYIQLNGFSVMGLRLWVVLGWLIQIFLVLDMAQNRLNRFGLILLAGFLWLTDSRYLVYQHHFWSGFTAFLSVYCAWRYLKTRYTAQPGQVWLLLSGLLLAATFWITQSLGVLMLLGLLAFSLLHCLLHEREERDLAFSAVSKRMLFKRWLNSWGTTWLLPQLAAHGLIMGIFLELGIWDDFWRDSVLWLWQGHYRSTTALGYFSTFHLEFLDTLRPLLTPLPSTLLPVFLFRVPIALHVFLIGMLPVIGILGIGYQLPGRFLYRLLQRQDEELLLWWLSALAMIFSTFSYSTSMHIVSNGAIAYFLGVLVLGQWVTGKFSFNRICSILSVAFLVSLLLGAVVGSLMQARYGAWLPPLPGLQERLLYTQPHTSAPDYLTVVDYLNQAARQSETVFVYNESPSLYLTSPAENATRFTLIIPFYTNKAQMREILQDLKRRQPLYIINDQADRFRSHDVRFRHFPANQLNLPEIETYIRETYVLESMLGRYLVFKRRESR